MLKNDQDKFYLTNDMDFRKFELEDSKLDFEKEVQNRDQKI